MTVSHAMALWLDEVENLVDPATHLRYEESARLYVVPHVGDLQLVAFGRRQVKTLLLGALAEKRKDGRPRFAKSTVRTRIFSVVRTFLAWAVDEELIAFNPAADLGRKLFRRGKHDATPRSRSMTAEQMARWCEAVEQLPSARTRLGLMVMLDAGLRLSEMAGLQEGDFDTINLVLHIRRQVRYVPRGDVESLPKSRAGTRDVEMSARVLQGFQAAQAARGAAALRRGRSRVRWVCWDFSTEPNRHEADVCRKHYERAMRRACLAAGIGRFTPHQLRHTVLTHLADQGEHLGALQHFAGHASTGQTEEYTKDARPKPTVPIDRIARISDRHRQPG